SFAVAQYKKGQYSLILNEEDKDKVLLKIGVKSNLDQINPNYPMMAWDPKGTRLSVLYGEEGRLKLFVYDAITRIKPYKQDLTDVFDQVQDMSYMLDSKTLLFSAVKNGHTDIFTYDIENEKVKQVTNDIYDDLDASFVAFPNKQGILFSSNRPNTFARGADTVLPNNRYNVFLITDFATNKPELNQISQLTNVKHGDARYPTQYNNNHFTFVSDQNGVGNRYAGFFTTERAGLDTLVLIRENILRNPTPADVDSALKANNQQDVDSIAVVSITNDSAYTFPLTNYSSSLRETRVAGDNNQVSEVTRQSDEKYLYKLKIDENTLRKRNISSTPTEYMRRILQQDRLGQGTEIDDALQDTSSFNKQDIFQNEFDNTKDSSSTSKEEQVYNAISGEESTVLSSAKIYEYKPRKYSTDYLVSGFNNSVLINRFQQFQGGAGPITLSSSTALNGIVRMGTSDIMEDMKFSGGFRLSTNLKDNDWLFQFHNLRKRIDWGLTFYRNVQDQQNTSNYTKLYSNLFQGSLSYPLDVARSVRLNLGVRKDRNVIKSLDESTLGAPDIRTYYALAHLEYVYDNTLNPVTNIWNGVRYKGYIDLNSQIDKASNSSGKYILNIGFDGRAYYPIYRNLIWAGRAAGDFSWGSQKIVYYLGGIDNWMMFGQNEKIDQKTGELTYRYFNPNNPPANDGTYAFQSLAVNMRGFVQNAANGNNNVVLNSEFRLPVFTTLFSKPINNAFLRNFQLTQFIDLGTAWNGRFDKLKRPNIVYGNEPVQVNIKAGGIGPFLGGYGFGVRSTLLGYFVKLDAGWPMTGIFDQKPKIYLSLGLDF
ncbi:MAG: hypothetical protein ABIR81_00630, partial [Ginsengibacter sp.]